MGHERYPNLFSPLQLRGAVLKNRIVQSALTSASGQDGQVSERMLNIYRARARGGAAMIVTESLAGHSRQQVGRRIRAMEEESLPGLERWAAAVESENCRLLGQLMDPGRGRHHAGRSFAAVGPSVLPDDLSWSVPRALTTGDIARMIEELAQTAHRLERAGFSGVELSCGHGHLFHQFLSPQANRREDAYGGTRENRTRLVRELCDAIRLACGPGFLLGIKLVGEDGVPGGVDTPEAIEIAALIARHGPDYFAMAQGAHFRLLEMHVPDRTYPPAPYRTITRAVRAAGLDVPVLAVGGITTPQEAEDVIASGDADGVMLGRALLAEPEWPHKARTGEDADLRLCVACNTCWQNTVAGHPLACDVNPRVGEPREARWSPPIAGEPGRIVVVGAGIAGLEAAWIAAARGHHVTLFGTSDTAGGKAALNARIPGCEKVGRSTAYRLHKLGQTAADVRLGTRADVDAIRACAPDRVLLATGARMQPPPGWPQGIATPDARTLVATLLAEGADRKAGTAVLYDADHTPGTYDVADWLARLYDRLVIVTPREGLAQDLATVIRQRVYRRLAERHAIIVPLSEIVTFADGTVEARNVYNGDLHTIDDVALLTYSSWRRPNDALLAPLTEAGLEVTAIGDCFAPRPLLEVLAESHHTALAL